MYTDQVYTVTLAAHARRGLMIKNFLLTVYTVKYVCNSPLIGSYLSAGLSTGSETFVAVVLPYCETEE